MKHLFNLLIVVAVSLITGCATFDAMVVSTIESMGFTPDYRHGQGKDRVFDAPFDKVWKALPEAMTSLGFDRVYPALVSRSAKGGVRAFRPITVWSGKPGDSVMIFVDGVGEDRTRVEVISKRPSVINWIYHDWAPEVWQKIEQMLLQGKPREPQQLNPFPMGAQQ